MASTESNRKVAKNRGNQWKQKLVAGRIEAELHPTKLKLMRVRKLISQEKAAQLLGKSLATYGAIERARRLVSADTAKKICSMMNTQIKVLFNQGHKGKFIALK